MQLINVTVESGNHDFDRGRLESWKVMEEYHKRGVLKAIGVSNYEVRHLEEVISHSETVPHVNQIEIHPHFQNRWET